MELSLQEVGSELYQDLPEPVWEILRQWKPSPLYRAIKLEMELAEVSSDVVVGCTDGGYNFTDLVLPFIGKQLRDSPKILSLALEPKAYPFLTWDKYTYNLGDIGNAIPLT